jgi:hypothetical protein
VATTQVYTRVNAARRRAACANFPRLDG